MKILLKILTDKQLMSSLVSVLGAFVAACAAGCKLAASDVRIDINPYPCYTNNLEIVK